MKKTVMCILIIVMCIVTSCCKNDPMILNNSSTNSEDVQNMNNSATLIVNGKDISPGNAVSINYEKQYAVLPLRAIMEALGGEVEWNNEESVILEFNNTRFFLNPTKNTLTEEGGSFNIIAVPPGTEHGGVYQVRDEEFMIDSDSLCHFMYLLGFQITSNYDSAVIQIDFADRA